MKFRESVRIRNKKIRPGIFYASKKVKSGELTFTEIVASDPQFLSCLLSRQAKAERHYEKYNGNTMRNWKRLHRKECGQFNDKNEFVGYTMSLKQFIREQDPSVQTPKVERILLAA